MGWYKKAWCGIILSIGLLLLSVVAIAQTTGTTFKILDDKQTPLPAVTVAILPLPDTIHLQQQRTDSTGTAQFSVALHRPYLVRISAIGYELVEKAITISHPNPTYTFTLSNRTTTLHAVVVTASRPLIRQEDDKTIVDPENLAASSTNAYEIIEKTPGLFVDQDGNIYLSSTTPATVYINGREQKMSAADMATLLKSLPPGAIASIEILRTPSARYDASSSGGIVNVVLKKGVRIGLTGSVNTGFNQGQYGNRFVGLNVNNNNGRLTTYLSLQYNHRNNYEKLQSNRLFAADSMLTQEAVTTYLTGSYYAGFGINYGLSKKWEVAYDGRITYNRAHNSSNNRSQIRTTHSTDAIVDNKAFVNTLAKGINLSQSISAKYKIDSLGSEWTNDINYTYAPNNTVQNFATQFYIPILPIATGDNTIHNGLHFISAQSNWQQKVAAKITLETGLKSTLTLFTNHTDYYRQVNGNRTKDNLRTGAYRYTETINSAYLQASRSFSGIVLKAGARLENTHMNGDQKQPLDTAFGLHRLDLFPYIYLSRNVMTIAGYDLRAYLVYRRTISRPAYEYLNPSPRYIDPYLFETGNPSLRPQFTKNYEANISVNDRPIIALGYNDTKDIFTQVIYQADSSHSLAYRTYDNLGRNKETYFRALGAIPPGKRYFFVVGMQYNHNFYTGLYEAKPLQFEKGSWSFFTYQTLRLSTTTQLVLNGFARFHGQLQFYELSSFGAINVSIHQQLLDKKLTVSLSGTDLFFTNNNHFTLQQGSVNASGYRESDTRRIGLNLRYNFGFRKKEEARNIFNMDSPEKTTNQ